MLRPASIGDRPLRPMRRAAPAGLYLKSADKDNEADEEACSGRPLFAADEAAVAASWWHMQGGKQISTTSCRCASEASRPAALVVCVCRIEATLLCSRCVECPSPQVCSTDLQPPGRYTSCWRAKAGLSALRQLSSRPCYMSTAAPSHADGWLCTLALGS